MVFDNFVFDRWQIAYRMKRDDLFTLLPNPPWGWAADPFPILFRGELYIFAEIFLYQSERNGIIAYSKFENGCFTDWTVSMDKHWHLSYPNVFVVEDTLYLCPESYQNDEIAVYELQSFPDQWKKVRVLLSNLQCVDTTFFADQGKDYMVTFKREKGGVKGELYLYRMEEEDVTLLQTIAKDDGKGRPGGRFFYQDGRLIRVSQNNTNGYGGGLIFHEVDRVEPVYAEHEVRRISAQDVQGNWKRKFTGIHTYNRAEDVEVIDLRYRCVSLIEYLARKRVRKVFQNKYGSRRERYCRGR